MISTNEAQHLLRQGRLDDAGRAFAQILESDPTNVAALNFTALAALRKGDIPTALEFIQTALRGDRQDPLTLHNQGQILNAAGRHEEAADAQRAALRSAPQLHAARLYLGQALELAGRPHESVVAYARALQDAQKDGRWLDQSNTPTAFRPLIEHAVTVVRRERRAAIDTLMQPLTRQFGRNALARVESGLRALFKDQPVNHQDPRQRPSFFYLPELPASPYLDPNLFPWVESYEAMTPGIRAELYGILNQAQGRERVFLRDDVEAAHLRGLDHPPSWTGYYFYRHGMARTENHERCPRTAAALEALPLCRIRDHGPEVMFSVFTAGTQLLAHRGVTNVRLVCHLPVIVPDRCALVVAGETRCWHEGKVVIFDDTYEHEAWNKSDRARIVLIADVWHPQVTSEERAALAVIFSAMGDFRHEVEVDP